MAASGDQLSSVLNKRNTLNRRRSEVLLPDYGKLVPSFEIFGFKLPWCPDLQDAKWSEE